MEISDNFKHNTLLGRSKLVCTKVDLTKLKDVLNKSDVIESCSRENINSKWRFYRLTNLTVLADLLKDILLGCNDEVLPKPQLRNGTINNLTFEENTRHPYNDNLCLFRAFPLPLNGSQRLEGETGKIFIFFLDGMDGLSPNLFQGIPMNDIPVVEDLLTTNILL